MRQLNIMALLVFLGAVGWIFTWPDPAAHAVKKRIMSVFSPFMRTGTAIQENISTLSAPARTPSEMAAENASLHLQIERQQILNEEYDRVVRENNELRGMLSFAKNHPLHLTTARILTRHTATYWSTALIDRGLADNLAPDLPVRTAEGLVGKIVHLYDRESEVLFITDETCKVAVRIEGTTEQGILTGVRGITSRSPELRITYLPSEAIVPVGAKVFTSGKGTVFPPDILVGEVIRFNKLDDGGEAVVRPAVDFDKIKYVFVIDRSPAASAPAAATTPPRPEVAPQ
jgi:rod shape-determining protein MreC